MGEDKLAVLIDADNVPHAKINEMLNEMATLGTLTIKRIYADWTKPHVNGWKQVLLENAITPIQQYSYTTGKNSSDSALIIDAMDILYSGKVSGFCIVSSDSDFTRLATRLRESGLKVYGFGEKKTPKPFITACDKFTYIEILKPDKAAKPDSENKTKPKPKIASEAMSKVDPEMLELIAESVSEIADESGWAYLGNLGSFLSKRKPDFDPRNYGFPKLLPLIKSSNKFEVDERESNLNSHAKSIYIRLKSTNG